VKLFEERRLDASVRKHRGFRFELNVMYMVRIRWQPVERPVSVRTLKKAHTPSSVLTPNAEIICETRVGFTPS
jgi:hypothetical protein